MAVRRLGLAAALLLAACVPDGLAPRAVPTPGLTPTPTPTPPLATEPPPTPTPGPTVTPTGRAVNGIVTLRTATLSYFQHNQAFRLLSTPVGGGLATFTTLEEGLLTHGGSVIQATTDAEGRFTVFGELDPDAAGVASVAMAGGHRLSALLLPGSKDLTIDEASSQIVELARWQVPTTANGSAGKALHDWTSDALDALYQHTLALLKPGDFTTTGSPPVIETLQAGAGFKLRHRYVADFGSQVTAAGKTDADQLSDGWRALLGFRPLALTVLAGGGTAGDDVAGRSAVLAGPSDARTDAAGNTWIVEHDAHLIRVIAGANRGPWLARATNMTVGRLYTLMGTADGPKDRGSFEALYKPYETAAATNSDAAPYAVDPATRSAFPLFSPRRLVLEVASGDVPSVYIASDDANRVFWIPAVDQLRFGRQARAGRLYTLAGTGDADGALGDGGPAGAASLGGPGAIARTTQGDLLILDPGHGSVRVVRARDGKIQALPLQSGGQALAVPGASDMQLVEGANGNALYVADPARNVVWRAGLPADIKALAQDSVAPIAMTAVLGQSGVAATPAPVGSLYAANAPVDKAGVALSGVGAIALDAANNLLASEPVGRLRLLEAQGITGSTGGVWTVGGALVVPPGAGGATATLEGDSRLAGYPGTAALELEPSGDLLIADPRANVVRRLWLRRGY